MPIRFYMLRSCCESLSSHSSHAHSQLLNHLQLFLPPWTVAHQTPRPMGFPWQEHWSGLPFPSPVDLPDQGIVPGSPTLLADSLPAKLPGMEIS